jgi:hypothetical protein
MAEWDRLVLCCSNNLPVTVSEKLIDGSFELCFCCIDSPSMEVINLPCCKASVHRHCVLEALQSNNQCVYCWKVLDLQDVIDCTPQPMALSGEANVSQTTTLTELKAPPEANTSGEANVSQTTTLPELKAPPEANMSQKDISAKINPPNILSEPPVQDEDMNLHEQPVEGEERSLSGMSTFGQNNNNGLLFAPTCTTGFNENKYLSTSEKKCALQWKNECLNSTGEYILFPSGMFHHGYCNDKSNRIFIQEQLFCAPTEYTDVLQLPQSIMKEKGKDVIQGHLDESTLLELRDDLINNCHRPRH